MVNSAPKPSWSWPVAPSTPISSRPVAPARTIATGRRPSGTGEDHQGGGKPPHEGGHDRGDEGRGDQALVEEAGRPVAESDREGLLARGAVGRDVAQVVDDEQRAGQRTDGRTGHDREGGQALRHDVGRAGGGDEPEEDEHEQLAEAVVAVGLRPAGVEPARGDGGRPDQQQDGADGDGEGQTGQGGDAEGEERGPLDRLGRRQPGRHQPHRPDAGGVGAADAVAVVVGVVRADLQAERHHERGRHPPPDHPALADRARRADGDRHHGRRQRPRPGPGDPAPGALWERWRPGPAHGRRGNRATSGICLSLKASRKC